MRLDLKSATFLALQRVSSIFYTFLLLLLKSMKYIFVYGVQVKYTWQSLYQSIIKQLENINFDISIICRSKIVVKKSTLSNRSSVILVISYVHFKQNHFICWPHIEHLRFMNHSNRRGVFRARCFSAGIKRSNPTRNETAVFTVPLCWLHDTQKTLKLINYETL